MTHLCERCGQDRGIHGVTTVVVKRTQDGRLVFIYARECRPCAEQQARLDTHTEGGRDE